MSISSIQSSIKSGQAKLKRLRAADVADGKKAAKLGTDARTLEDRASKSRSASMASQHQGNAGRKLKELGSLNEKIAKRKGEIGDAETKLLADQEKLRVEEEKERKKAAAKAKQDKARQDRQDTAARRAQDSRLAAQDREVAQLRTKTTELEDRLISQERSSAPGEVSVLFVAATPDDQGELKISREVREIQKRVRLSEHRDSIFFEWALARQVTDLIQDLNEADPHILHFSGHGSESDLCFEDAEGKSVLLSNDQLDSLLRASANRIRLAVFNSCDSHQQARNATQRVEVAVGMSTSIQDDSAKIFSAQFYNSLGFGNSVGRAFKEACLQLELELGEDHDVPQLFAAEGVDPNTVVLVNPDE